MKKNLLLILLVIFSLSAMAQNRIPKSNVSFGFPNGGWKYLNTIEIDESSKVYLYCYSEKTVIDAIGDTILPYMKIYVTRDYTDELFNLVYKRYEGNPYQTIEEYTEGLPSADGIGYKAIYKNMKDNKDYMFNMIYFKDKKTSIEIRLETTKDTYNQFEQDFKDILSTVKVSK